MPDLQRKFQPLFNPRSVAFIGASNKPRKWGSIVLSNLINGGFQGAIYPVNPKDPTIKGIRAYARIADLPETPDLAVILVPPSAVSRVIEECIAKGIKAGLVITAGFAEVGSDGEQLQRLMVDRARAGDMILVGPNCNGIMSPPSKLYVAMPPIFPPPGPVAVVAQSGNVATSIVRRGMKRGFGCSCFVSSGNEADLHCEDYFDYLADDPDTKVILSYIEGFRDGARLFETAKRVTVRKPIVMLKAGGTSAGAKAAKSHTAALAGSDSAFDGACRQAGIIRARNVDELCSVGVGLIGQPLPRGNRVGIVTAGGGWGVLAADACVRAGLELPDLPKETIEELDTFLPEWWTRSNPVDLVAGLGQDHPAKSLKVLLQCPEIDGVILLGIMPALPFDPLPPSAPADVIEQRIQAVLEKLCEIYDEFMGLSDQYRKPVIVASEIPAVMADLEERMAYVLGERGYVLYTTPDDAALVMAGLVRYADYLRSRVHGLPGREKGDIEED